MIMLRRVLVRNSELQGWQGRNGGADLRPAPRPPDRNPRPAPSAPVRPIVTTSSTQLLSPGTLLTTSESPASPIV